MSITSKQLAQLRKGKRPSKYRAVRTEYNGVTYASKAEAARAAALDMLISGGEVLAVERQPRFTLGCPENVYVADFKVQMANGKWHIEDVKGMETAKFRHDKKLWKAYGPMPLHIIRKGKTVETITPIEEKR